MHKIGLRCLKHLSHDRRILLKIASGPASLALLAGCVTIGSTTERVTLIDPAQGERATTTCSRAGPENPSRFFTPSAREVTAIESAAMRLLRENRADYEALLAQAAMGSDDSATPFDWPDDPSLYDRQYIGYYEDGRRMIYGSYFPAGFRLEPGEPVVLCDGGFRFFGAANEVRRLAFDGTRGGPIFPPIER